MMSEQEWRRRADESLALALERRRQRHADPGAIAGWFTAILIALMFWGAVFWIAVHV